MRALLRPSLLLGDQALHELGSLFQAKRILGELRSLSGSVLRWRFSNGQKTTNVLGPLPLIGDKASLKERFADLRDATSF